MMAREYGYTPTEIMGMTGLHRAKRFHLDFDIYAATSMFIQEERERRMDQQDPRSARVASPQERTNMIQDETSRAKQRESMDQAGMDAPSPEGQIQQLDDVLAKRKQTDTDGMEGAVDGR